MYPREHINESIEKTTEADGLQQITSIRKTEYYKKRLNKNNKSKKRLRQTHISLDRRKIQQGERGKAAWKNLLVL